MEHHRRLTGQGLLRHIAQVVPVNGDASFRDVIEAVEQGYQGALACPSLPDQRHRLPRLNTQVNPL